MCIISLQAAFRHMLEHTRYNNMMIYYPILIFTQIRVLAFLAFNLYGSLTGRCFPEFASFICEININLARRSQDHEGAFHHAVLVCAALLISMRLTATASRGWWHICCNGDRNGKPVADLD